MDRTMGRTGPSPLSWMVLPDCPILTFPPEAPAAADESGRYLAAALAAQRISIRGARTHNLKNIDLDIPRNQLGVITGLSG